jgi:hypothetical protein
MAIKKAVKDQAVASAVKERLTGTVGTMGEKLFGLRDKKRELEEQIKALDEESSVLSEQLMERMDKEGLTKVSCKSGTVSTTVSMVADVTDWDALHAYIAKTKQFHLLQRRVSDASWRELFEKKGAVPGTQPFNKKKLNLRAAS